ncbi:rab geranylgeranyl transferase escort protein [Coccidioides immitis RS]|uniref:Rab proteins geranylgeranyltransferase n=2 Tax=Coccidioides immitis TaxID=5501 RepID=J3K6V2_COCIM|nr:rab geranylgeranyl transferase escort protein [Coccidioides immitis RS]EAS30346.3 rab geranylgeranyl transferase escort protein [Coccidioides immitis RS]TPX23336.1 Rab proteins geranylgeranyltransferase component A [Coccidioides immitis]
MLGQNTLNDTTWDVLISGTGLPQSLLALALSRSGKKVLHIDKNDYYGGSEAAFSLQEAEHWVNKVGCEPNFGPFESASVWRSPSTEKKENGKLSFSRAYTLSLSPQLIYTRSKLLPSLVSSKVYRQLEFQAMGNWWVYRDEAQVETGSQEHAIRGLQCVPSSREDVFADDTLTMKSKRSLMKFLRYLGQSDESGSSSTEEGDFDTPFSTFLRSKFQVHSDLYYPLLCLCLSPHSISQTTAGYALPKIKRHLQSIGVFGPGFSSVVTKWGGASEIAQVACRACAVGGGVYALNRGIRSVGPPAQGSPDGDSSLRRVCLSDGETVCTRYIVGTPWDIPADTQKAELPTLTKVSRSVMIVSSPLEALFPPIAENDPVAAGTLVIFPGQQAAGEDAIDEPPLYLLLHSSDTGECPFGQCIIYASVLQPSSKGHPRIDSAVQQLLKSTDPVAEVLWKMQFTQLGHLGTDILPKDGLAGVDSQILVFPSPCLDLEFNDSMIDQVRHVWKDIMGADADENEFLVFENREAAEEENMSAS